jgi:hypothetical protein
MKYETGIEVGKCDHTPTGKRNSIPIELELCADSRRDECPYYVKVFVNTEEVSFYQGFCAWKFRKGNGS